jgi:hypothetical protein
MKRLVSLLIAGVLLTGAALAQSSASFRLEEHTFNAGGHPEAGGIPSSPSFRITLHSIGEGISGQGLNSASFNLDACFASAFAPPGEVMNLRFVDGDSLEWDPEKSVGDYNLYRGLISVITGLGFGACDQEHIAGPTTDDTDVVPANDGYFYLVAAENRLDEEGTKGFQSDTTERGGTACP